MAVYTPLEPAELAALAAAHGLPPPERAEPEPRGGVNTNYHLWAGGRRWFLRVAEGRDEADVAFEAAVVAFLHGAGFPVAPLRPVAGGGAVARVRGKPALLFGHAPGEVVGLRAAGPAHCRQVGALLGRLHALGRGFAGGRPNPFGPARVRGWLDELGDGGADAEVAAALPALAAELAATRLPAAPRGLVHGDLFVDNVLWVGERASAVLDWEMACTEALAWDLGVALNAWCYADRFEPDRAAALLEGYRSARQAEPETLAALPAHARLAALRFAVSRIHGYHRASLGPDRLRRKDWRRYRDRLAALRAMGDEGVLELCGLGRRGASRPTGPRR